ncbi:Uncharacterised protein [Mycobacterium tuberculosis]|nr:Uncharacterised protein [Mycobacterium tuberculosis]
MNTGVGSSEASSPRAVVKLCGIGARPGQSKESKREPKPASATVSMASFCRSLDTSTGRTPTLASHRSIILQLMSSIAA